MNPDTPTPNTLTWRIWNLSNADSYGWVAAEDVEGFGRTMVIEQYVKDRGLATGTYRLALQTEFGELSVVEVDVTATVAVAITNKRA